MSLPEGDRVLGQPALVAGMAFNAVALALALLLFKTDIDAFTRFTREDGFAEWMQFLCFASLALLSAFVAADKLASSGRLSLPVAGLIALCGAFLFAALEEVSYFQRVIGVATPEFFLKHNKQSEMNLHNLMIGEVSVSKHILVKLVAIFALTHNLVLPLLSRRFPAVRTWVEGLGFYLPPWRVAAFYLLLVVISQAVLVHNRKGEVLELMGCVHYLTTAFAAYFAGANYAGPVFSGAGVVRRVSWAFVLFLGLLVLVAWILGAISVGAKA